MSPQKQSYGKWLSPEEGHITSKNYEDTGEHSLVSCLLRSTSESKTFMLHYTKSNRYYLVNNLEYATALGVCFIFYDRASSVYAVFSAENTIFTSRSAGKAISHAIRLSLNSNTIQDILSTNYNPEFIDFPVFLFFENGTVVPCSEQGSVSFSHLCILGFSLTAHRRRSVHYILFYVGDTGVINFIYSDRAYIEQCPGSVHYCAPPDMEVVLRY